MKFALIVDDRVQELFTEEPELHPDLELVEVDDAVLVGFGRQPDGSWTAPQPPVVDLLAYAADARWRRETGGILVGSVPVSTDDRSKLMITGARVAAAADPDWSTTWSGSDGNIYPLDVAAMVAISDAVQAHVNASFATFATVKVAIEAGTITTMAEIDAAFGVSS